MGVGSLDPGEGWAASAEAGGGGAGRARTATLSGEPRGASVPAPDLVLRNLPVPWRCFGVSPGARKPRGGGLPGLRGLRPGLGGAGRATRAERRWRCPQAAGRRGRRAPGHRRPQDERPGHGGAALAAAVPLPGPAAGRPGLRQRGQVGLRSELSASAVLKAGRPPSSFPGVTDGEVPEGVREGARRRGHDALCASLHRRRSAGPGLPEPAPGAPAPLAALLVLGISQGWKRRVTGPTVWRRLASARLGLWLFTIN